MNGDLAQKAMAQAMAMTMQMCSWMATACAIAFCTKSKRINWSCKQALTTQIGVVSKLPMHGDLVQKAMAHAMAVQLHMCSWMAIACAIAFCTKSNALDACLQLQLEL